MDILLIENFDLRRQIIFEKKKYAELSNLEIRKVMKSQQIEINKLRIENNNLQSELIVAKEKMEDVAMTEKDRLHFIEALQKLSASRMKYKKLTEELQQELQTNKCNGDDIVLLLKEKDDKIIELYTKHSEQNVLIQDAIDSIKSLEIDT
jgi:hypothetical protein